MNIESFFPIWNKLAVEHQEMLNKFAVKQTIKKGTVIHDGGKECAGLVLVCSGQFRSYILSEDGREVTLYRMFERDICILCASCAMKNIQFDIIIEAEKNAEVWVIPPYIFKKLTEESLVFSNYSNELMQACFSEVMWMIEQILWKSLDKRLAEFLLAESAVENTNILEMTHEKIANHLGTAREVMTRMLRYFQSEGMVVLRRGIVEIIDMNKLEAAGR